MASNEQLLLNLARLRNHHPPHFLQMGAISAQFNFNGGLTGDYKDTGGIITSTFGLSLGASETPVFNFTPLSGAAYSEILLTPIQTNVLYSLINQNLPVSVLMRLMVDRITLTSANGDRATFRNQFNRADPESYGNFLRFTAFLEQLMADDEFEFKVGKAGKVRFSLSPQIHRAMGKLAAADPRYKLVNLKPRTGEDVAEIEIHRRSFLTVLASAANASSLYDKFSAEFLQG
jgi:hypothetical protein